MKQILNHIHRAQIAQSHNDGDKLRAELEHAAKLVEVKLKLHKSKNMPCQCHAKTYVAKCNKCGRIFHWSYNK